MTFGQRRQRLRRLGALERLLRFPLRRSGLNVPSATDAIEALGRSVGRGSRLISPNSAPPDDASEALPAGPVSDVTSEWAFYTRQCRE